MVTQKIVTRLSNDVLPPVRMVSGDVGREIQLEIYANDESLAPIDLETYSARITIIKPDKTFVIQDFDNDKVELPEQAGAVTGHGYYQIKIYTAGDHQIYTGQGPFIVDDDVLSEEMIESVAEVNGYEFPDDFLTDADLREYVTKYELEDALAGIIDDDTTDYNSTWSSAKISDLLSTVTKTATGNPIEISDGADAPLVKCVTQITGYQEGSGTPSPSNIRPIVAYTEGEIEVRGKNLVKQIVRGYINSSTNAIRIDDDSVTVLIKVERGETYTFSAGVTTNRNMIGYVGVDELVNGTPVANIQTLSSYTWRAEWSGWTAWYINANASANVEATAQVEKGGTVTPYEPYTSTTHTTTYPSAIYRGSEDCVKGEVTSVWGMIASYAGETLPGEWISDRDEYAPGTTPTTGAQVAYALATTTTSSVTPTNLPIKSLSGYSHIESTTGEMEVEYIVETYDAIMKAAQLDNMKVYSTAEQVVGKWIDGTTDVYEKTFVIEPASPPMDWVGFFTVNMAALVSVEGYTVYNASGQTAYTTLYDAYYGCRFAYNPAIARGQLCYYYNNGDITKIVVTVRYTKGV